jgi:hypothetical protein
MEALSVRTFREREKAKRTPSPAADALRAVRKLNRALHAVTDPGSLQEEEAQMLRRALLRTSRNIARLLAALGLDADGAALAAEERSAEPTPLRRVAAAAGDAGPVLGRVVWPDSVSARFRRSS